MQFAILVKCTGAYCPETVLQHLQSHSRLEPFQFAYRKCQNTETALLRVVNDLLQTTDSGCVPLLSLLDLSATFDKIDHIILITRLRATFGCSGMVLDWFISHLSHRTQSVFVGHESTPSIVHCGVPRGSVLGPLLFNLYTHPLSTVICQSGLSIISLQMIPSFTNQVFLLTFQFLLAV